ncbi:MAG: glycosyltransferase family protein [Oleidesulfovibrio sp.]
MGHFFRSLEICKALSAHEITLVTGGHPVDIPLPPHVRNEQLPPLMMDADFSALRVVTPAGQSAVHEESSSGSTAVAISSQPQNSETIKPETAAGNIRKNQSENAEHLLDQLKKQRALQLQEIMQRTRPDILLIELFPFGRRQFSFELAPLLDAVKEGRYGSVKTVCSVRDILVEKADQAKYEQRVINALNQWFDAVFVHTDPAVVRLGETFSRLRDIAPTVLDTGYVTPLPEKDAGNRLRNALDIKMDLPVIVASAGSGSVGFELLLATVKASALFARTTPHKLFVFTGPFMAHKEATQIKTAAAHAAHISVERFTPHFADYLAMADSSISLAGYNTTMNLLAAGTYGFVLPFDQNREQRMRSERLERLGALKLLETTDLVPQRLASLVSEAIAQKKTTADAPVDLHGAEKTALLLESLYAENRS